MSNWHLSNEDLRALIQGKFKFGACLECSGKGWVLVYEDGTVCQGVQAGTSGDDYYQDMCEDCEGLGGRLRLDA